MKVKKIPMRMCAITREKYPKKDLLRVVRTTENNIQVDLTGKVNGRGIYLKQDKDIISRVIDKKILDKLFEIKVNEEVYENLKKIGDKCE